MNTGGSEHASVDPELEELASYFRTRDTRDDPVEEQGNEPMVTASLRMPRELFERIKRDAQQRGVRHTTHIRELLEQGVNGQSATPDELAEIRDQLDRVLRAVEGSPRR